MNSKDIKLIENMYNAGIFKIEERHRLNIYKPEKQSLIPIDTIGDRMKLSPYPYQKDGIKYSVEQLNALLVCPCGAGKTPILLGIYDECIKNNIVKGKCIILVKASLKRQWCREVEKFTNYSASAIFTRSMISKNKNKIKLREEKQLKQGIDLSEEIKALQEEDDKRFEEQFNSDILILNYESLLNEEIEKRLHKINPQIVLADEIHYVKSRKAKRTKKLAKFNKAKVKVGATATPIKQSYEDAYAIFNFLNPKLFKNYDIFKKSYLKVDRWDNVIGYKNLNELKEKICAYSFVKTEEEVSSQLPELNVIQRYCDVAPIIAEMTAQITEEVKELREQEKSIRAKCKDQKDMETNPELQKITAKIMALNTFAQELADEPKLLEDSESQMAKNYAVGRCENTKLELLYDLVSEIIESGEKVCIFTRYVPMQKYIKNKLQDIDSNMKFAIVNGSITGNDRDIEVHDKFTLSDEYKVLLATDALAEGANLSSCKYLIEYDLADSYAIQTQRHGRIKRASSEHRHVTVYQLIALGSYDEAAFKIVSKKQKYDANMFKVKGIIEDES